MDASFKYRAFISYSHSNERWAKWLHRSLETYRLPKHMVGRQTAFGPVPERIAPVFRDRDELATSTDLSATLTQALEQSACQIVICSKAAAQSHWVNEEILAFKRLGREHRIFCLIVDGEPGASAVTDTAEQECFPNALRYTMGNDGALSATRSEPIAADARHGKDSKADVRLKLVAGMLGIGLDELKQREANRRQRRLLALVAASTMGMLITTGLATFAFMARNAAERERVRAEAEAETARQTTQFIVDLFKVFDPSEALGNRITAREILDKGADRIETQLVEQPAIQATLMDTMGTVYTSLGLYRVAIPLISKALDKRTALTGFSDSMVAQSLNHLGETLTLNGDYAEAEQRLRDALAIQRDLFGEQHPDVARTLTALADLMSVTGEYAKGEPLIKEALRIRRALYGEDHADVAESIGDLGVNYGERGEFVQAELYLREALAMLRKVHGAIHPQIAEAMNNLAWALMGLNHPEQAEPLYRDALKMKQRLLGNAHPDLAAGLNNLAFALETRGDYAQAETAYRESLAMNRTLLGERHPEVAVNMSNLAFVLYAKGDRPAAIAMLRESLQMNRQVLGAEHPRVAGGATNLAYWLIEAGAYDESERLLTESLAIRRKALGNNHAQVASTMTVKATLLLATQHFDEALREATQARQILEASLPKEHWQVAMAINVQGAALVGLGEYAKAEPLLLGSLANLAESPIPNLSTVGRSRLVSLYLAWGKPAQARKFQTVKGKPATLSLATPPRNARAFLG